MARTHFQLFPEGWLPARAGSATLSRLRRELGLRDEARTPLPDRLAPVALGDEPPPELRGETVEDLLSLGDAQLDVPDIEVSNAGTLLASGVGRFHLTVTSNADFRRGPFWKDERGLLRVMPLALADALEALERGPPPPEAGEPEARSTDRRLRWWAGIRRPLVKYGARLGGYLDGLDVIEVDRLKARLTPTGVEFDADGIEDSAAFNAALAGFDPRSRRDPTARWQDAGGRQRRQRLALTGRGARAAAIAGQICRSQSRGLAPALLDAPESLLNDEFFDLSEYGDRVLGVETVVYRVTRSQGVGPGGEPTTRIHLETPDGRQARPLRPEAHRGVVARLRRAAAQGQAYVRHGDDYIRVPTISRIDELEDHGPPAVRPRGQLQVALNIAEQTYAHDQRGSARLVDVGEVPPGLADGVVLYPHQVRGWQWLLGRLGLVDGGLDHGLLADDMGLGKTLQVLSSLASLEAHADSGPVLVVAPLSLLANWEAEARRFFPGRFTVLRFPAPRQASRAENLRRYNLVLCSYGTLRARQLEFGRVEWQVMVLDECHQIRNPRARTTRAVLAMNAVHRLGLSGTPVQNSLEDLWSQFDWLSPGFLGDLSAFKKTYSPDDATALNSLRACLRPRMLRRLKEDVAAHLPPKTGHDALVPVRMASWQAELYDTVLADREPGSALGTLHRLFQVCSAPTLVSAGVPDEHPKLTWLLGCLQSIRARGEKALVFAEWHALQQDLIERLESRFGVQVERINGKVEAGRRLEIVNAFNRAPGFQVLMLGPKAAGVGLNLVGANHVIHFTRHWNPAIEAQATDRAYRIGQTRHVHVYLPTMVHPVRASIEESLHELLHEKAALAREVVVPTSSLNLGGALERIVLRGDR